MLRLVTLYQINRKGTTFFSFLQDIAQKNRHLCPKTQMAILSQS